MTLKAFTASLAIGLSSILAAPSYADPLGKAEFLNSCAHCHGEDGKGGGTIVAYLNTSVPDLSQLTKENDGEFPYQYVLWMVDGRKKIQIHGGDMPVWGGRYMDSTIVDEAATETPEIRELIVRGRLMSLVNFLETIQE